MAVARCRAINFDNPQHKPIGFHERRAHGVATLRRFATPTGPIAHPDDA
jgi:hypothetical protein